LHKAGATLEFATNGREAVDTALAAQRDSTPFDMILMDMQMPVLDGYAATRELRESDYQHPIIALTAHAMDGDRERCIDSGCDDYVTKPVNRHVLVATIQRVLASAATDQAASTP
jgi:CheY-like chemotaxis protein